ncbi:MAG TPA: DUF4142 domain-containing protein [Blastocatellia bacterium]|nr:DUF4142 domain-containing protein [Blastocatellia bacterium]
MKYLMLSMVGALLGLCVTVAGQTSNPQSSAQTVPNADKQFAMKAAEASMAEVALGDLATKQAADEGVKQFGQRMRDEHTKANDELKGWASQKGVMLPSEPSAKQKQVADHLSKLSGAEFDREFARVMVKDHIEAVALFERQTRTGQDQELKDWANQKLPTLRDHLTESRNLASKLGVNPGNPPKTQKGR